MKPHVSKYEFKIIIFHTALGSTFLLIPLTPDLEIPIKTISTDQYLINNKRSIFFSIWKQKTFFFQSKVFLNFGPYDNSKVLDFKRTHIHAKKKLLAQH